MSDYLTSNWTAGDQDGQWLLVEFMDTDCPFCEKSADEIGYDAEYFMKSVQDMPPTGTLGSLGRPHRQLCRQRNGT